MTSKQNAAGSPPEKPGALNDGLAAIWQSMSHMKLPLETMQSLQQDYLQNATALWNQTLARLGLPTAGAAGTAPPAATPIRDRRFAASEWSQDPVASFTAQMYLLNASILTQMAEAVQAEPKTQARLRFAVQQWVDAASPSNILALNPEALAKAVATHGESLSKGLQHLLQDLQKGHVSQTDEAAFEVGRNVATSEGQVVFENAFFQLIEYKPLTPKVYERPMLFVPPCINKFYILDLQPENSLVRYTVEQGHHLFVVSWRNPDTSLAAASWDDYIEHGPIAAIAAVQAICKAPTLNVLGFCVGGTLLSTALAVLAARGLQPAHSLTLLTTLLDFADNGILDIFIDEAAVRQRETSIGNEAANGPGLLAGKELATTFSFLRPNDLVWNYVVGNYLKGEAPPPFDLLYWNGDSTNLPGPMYCWYLRHTYLQNDLMVPGRLTVCGEKLDLSRIQAPVFIYGSREDHIVPWDAAYRSVALFQQATPAPSSKLKRGKKGSPASGNHPRELRFVLGASGHIAGVINPPAKGKRSHWVNPQLPADAHTWLAGAQEVAGSWWPLWSAWLRPLGGSWVPAPRTPGNRQYPAIEPAPGRYVKAKA
jgi:polyhydroxyalkanoate synthase subunit PhaC